MGALVATVAGLSSFDAATAAESRTLDLYNTHTKERLTITFKKNGKYVGSALKELNRFLRDWRRNEPTNMDPRLFDTVWEVYSRAGSRQPIHVVSAYRSLATNNMLRSRSSAVAKHSQHTLGKAMDFFLPDVRVSKLREIGVSMQNGGVGFYPNANTPFVHIDVGSVRAWPRMSRQQLTKIFPDGKTVHLPADGKPLAGYQQALAELKRNGTVARPLAIADDEGGSTKKKGGLLAMLFGDEEDETEELNAATPSGQVLTAAPAKPAAPEPVAPVVAAPTVVVEAPVPPAAPAKPEAPVTSLAEATLPAGAPVPAAVAVAAATVPPPAPPKRPGDLVAEVEIAAVDPSVRPRPKPEMAIADDAPVLVASAGPVPLPGEPADAQSALAEVAAGESAAVDSLTALGYASATEPTPTVLRAPVRMASLTAAAPERSPGGIGSSTTAPGLAERTMKSDPLASLSRGEPAGDMPLYDPAETAYRGGFAGLSHPNQRSREFAFSAPDLVVRATFDTRPYGAMSSMGFSGVSLKRLPVAMFRDDRDLAMR